MRTKFKDLTDIQETKFFYIMKATFQATFHTYNTFSKSFSNVFKTSSQNRPPGSLERECENLATPNFVKALKMT